MLLSPAGHVNLTLLDSVMNRVQSKVSTLALLNSRVVMKATSLQSVMLIPKLVVVSMAPGVTHTIAGVNFSLELYCQISTVKYSRLAWSLSCER